MKKRFRSILPLTMALSILLALSACSSTAADTNEENSSPAYEEDPYIEVMVGDVLYSDDNCSVTIDGLEADDDGGCILTLSVTSSYEDGSLGVHVDAYDTDKFNTYLEKRAAGKDATVGTEEGYDCYTEEDEYETELSLVFPGNYVYFNISICAYSEFITQEQLNSGGVLEATTLMYDEIILINTVE